MRPFRGAVTRKGLVPMSKRKRILLMLARGGLSQADVAAVLHVSKRDVSAASRMIRERGLTVDDVEAMTDADADGLFVVPGRGESGAGYLKPVMGPFVERRRRDRRLTVKMFWMEYCIQAASAGLMAYSYQTFCEMFSDESERLGAVRHFRHEPGAKAFIDWAGDTAAVTDRLTGARSKVYVPVVCLPFSDRFWAQGFTDMTQRSWQEGRMRAFEEFGGVPGMLVPDNAATATDRSAARVTLVNREYERFAEHYGTAVVPARVRKPRDKSVAESTVNLVERWVIAPANETTFYTLDEFNEFCEGKVDWLNSRPFSAKEGSRRSVYEAEERACMQPLPAERYEMCEWRSAKVSPDYHIVIDYMHYSVPHALIGRSVDARLTDSDGHGDARRRRGGRASEAEGTQGPVLHDRRPHAARARRDGFAVVAGEVHVPGPPHRTADRPGDRTGDGGQDDRGAVVRPLPQHPGPVQDLHARAARTRLRAVERTRRPAELHRGPERDPRDQGRRQSRRPHARHTTTRRRAAGGQGEERRPPARRRRLPEGRASMLTEEHSAMLTSFRIRAMADKLREMIDDPSYDSLTFEERMEMLIDAEASARRDRKISKLVRQARFKLPSACVEDVLYLPGRKLDKDRVTRYAECRWVDECEVMVVISK